MSILTAGTLVHVPANVTQKVSDENMVAAVVTKSWDGEPATANVRVFSDNNEFEWRTNVVILDSQPDESDDPANVCWVAQSENDGGN